MICVINHDQADVTIGRKAKWKHRYCKNPLTGLLFGFTIHFMKRSQLISLLLIPVILAGCNYPGSTPVPTQTATTAPTNTPAPTATATTAPTDTPAPTTTLAQAAPTQPPAAAPTLAPTQSGPIPDIPTTFVKDQYIRAAGAAFAYTFIGSVTAGQYDRYRFSAANGEGLDIRLAEPQQVAGFVILGPNGQPLPGTETHRARWYSANAQTNGEYAILVTSSYGRSEYWLEVKINALAVTPTGGQYTALPEDECRPIRGSIRAALGVPLSISQSGFTLNKGSSGSACQLAGEATGKDFDNPAAVMDLIQSALGDWTLVSGFTADGANGSLRGFSRGTDLLMASVQWYPASGATCQPVSDCPKDQIMFSILVQVARK
jgi:hypothetical protein